ncbi:hypothetical protein [Blastococcus sp. SYSU D00813]
MRAHLLPLAALAGLGLAACAPAEGDTGSPPLERTVALAAGASDADLVSGLTVTAEGTALVTTVGPAGRSGVTVVDLPGGGTAAPGGSVALDDVGPDAVLASGDEVLVVGTSADGGYAVLVVDPATGAIEETRPVAGVEEAGEVEAAALPDGTVVVAADRPGGTPLVLLVDSATGEVRASAEVDLSAVPGERANLHALAVSPDGSRIALGLAVRAGGEWTPVVAVLDAGLTPGGDPVALEGGRVTALAVAEDGTAYAALAEASGVLAVDPAGGAAGIPAGLGEVTQLAVVGDELVAVDRGLTLTRLDPVAGTVGARVDLCTGSGAASGIGVAPDGSLVVVANCEGAGLWVVPA